MKRLLVAAAIAIGFFVATLIASVIILSLLDAGDDNESSTRTVTGNAMSPTLNDGQIVAFRAGSARERLDIVVYQFPDDPSLEYIGRIIGLPGEQVAVQGGIVRIDGEELREGYLREPPHYEVAPIELSGDEYYILGDNRNDSSDSHVWGPVPAANIVGTVAIAPTTPPATPTPP